MRPLYIAALILPLMSVVAGAQSDPIKARQAIMKGIGDQTTLGAAMVKGEAPFDATKAAAIFQTFAEGGAKAGALFPEGSDKGDTKALPAVWSDRAKFDAELAAFNKAVAEGTPKIGTADGFKTAFTAVAQTCRSCHSTFKAR